MGPDLKKTEMHNMYEINQAEKNFQMRRVYNVLK